MGGLFGGGSSSGGGSSGKVEFPAYIEAMHGDWLTELDAIIVNSIATNPYIGRTPYNPATDITAMNAAVSAYISYLATLSETWISNQISNQVTALISEWTNVLGPKFKAGMRDINAVMTSSFAYGQGVALAMLADKANLVGVALREKILVGQMEGERWAYQAKVATSKMNIDAQTAFEHRGTEIDQLDARWSFDCYMWGGNVMAAPGGGHAMPPGPSTAGTILGGLGMIGGIAGLLAG